MPDQAHGPRCHVQGKALPCSVRHPSLGRTPAYTRQVSLNQTFFLTSFRVLRDSERLLRYASATASALWYGRRCFSSPHAQQHHLIRQARVQAASHSAHSEQTATMTVMTPRVIKAAVMDSAGVSASPLLPVSVADECVFSVKSR